MLIKKPVDIRPSEITSEQNYLNRRQFIRSGAMAGGALLAPSAFAAALPTARGAALNDVGRSRFSTDEAPNSFEDITTYNNYYEFGTGKSDPYENAQDFEPRPWSISVDGQCRKNRHALTSMISSSRSISKSASIACAASRPGRWSFPGSVYRWPRSSSISSRRRKQNTSRLKR